jgi:hypothetical protein
MKKVRRFEAQVTYRSPDGTEREETFPVQAEEFSAAQSMAEHYVLQVLRLKEFELRMVGA